MDEINEYIIMTTDGRRYTVRASSLRHDDDVILLLIGSSVVGIVPKFNVIGVVKSTSVETID